MKDFFGKTMKILLHK